MFLLVCMKGRNRQDDFYHLSIDQSDTRGGNIYLTTLMYKWSVVSVSHGCSQFLWEPLASLPPKNSEHNLSLLDSHAMLKLTELLTEQSSSGASSLAFELWALRQTLINMNFLTWGDWKPCHMRNCWDGWGILVWKWLSMMIIFQYEKNHLLYLLLTQEVELTNEYEPKPICPIQKGPRVSLFSDPGFQISPLHFQIFSLSLAEVLTGCLLLELDQVIIQTHLT